MEQLWILIQQLLLSAFNVAKLNKIKISYSEILRMCKITLRFALEYISEKCSKPYEILFKEYLQEYSKFDISTLIIFPYVQEVLNTIINKGGENYIVTHRGKDSLIEHLQQKEISHLFSYMITGDSNFNRKPEPDAFLFLKDKFNLDPADTIVVGDRLLDVQAGYGAGFKGILYQNTADFAGKLTEINNYSQLMNLVKDSL